MGTTEKNKIKAIVVEDEEKILANICNKILSLDDSFEIVERAANGQEAIEKIEELRPQVVFTDISMPVMGGMELIKRIKQLNPSTIIVIISGLSDFSYAQQAIRYGIFNYLLKPLENDILMETLFDIKKRLSYFDIKQERHIIYSENYELTAEEQLMIVSVCMGNYIYNTQDEEVLQFYRERIGQVSWNKIMRLLCGGRPWFVADDHVINQKIIGVRIKKGCDYSQEIFTKELARLVKMEVPLSVSMSCMRQTIAQEEMWDYVKRLRNVIKQRLVVGEDSVFYLEEEETVKNDMIEIVKVKLSTYIKNYFISTNLEHFMNEIGMIFNYMRSNHASQESIERICLYVLKLLEFSNQGYEREFLEKLQDNMLKSISMSISEEELFENLIQEFQKVNSYMEKVQEENEETQLLDYINERYLTIESMEEVAEEFGYNYAYLSRMFKKKVGESMNRYITRKKIELAKELLCDKPDMRLTEISDLCGYNEYRYFSRVFKAETGMSPSEYKEKL